MNLVKQILERSRRRLVTVGRDATACEVASALGNVLTPLVVVCDRDGVAVGVISRVDIVRVFGRDHADAVHVNAAAIMSSPIRACGVDEPIQSVWKTMTDSGLRSLPVLDVSGRPMGVAHARDIASALLDEVNYEEHLLRDYVLGIGYQ